jgi:threonine/homoserine/homoserine lactone efflux protein
MNADFLITALIIVAIPGTGALYTIATGLTCGRRQALAAAFGCTLGIIPHMAAAMTGLATLLNGSPLAFNIVKACGVAYLVYMAIGLMRAPQAMAAGEKEPDQSFGAVIMKAILINLLNPKLSLFFLAFMPQFIDPAAPDILLQMIRDSLVFMGLTLAVFALYGLFAASMRTHVIESPKMRARINRAFGLAFLAMAMKLALTER